MSSLGHLRGIAGRSEKPNRIGLTITRTEPIITNNDITNNDNNDTNNNNHDNDNHNDNQHGNGDDNSHSCVTCIYSIIIPEPAGTGRGTEPNRTGPSHDAFKKRRPNRTDTMMFRNVRNRNESNQTGSFLE